MKTVQMNGKKHRLWLPILLLATGLLFCGSGAWIHAKALLAQVLLRHAWQQTISSGQPVRPWPWADIRPAARLGMDRLGRDLIVLDSQAGAALAFGPGMLKKGAGPGQPGACILAGHRDTSFRFLARVKPGDLFTLQDKHGKNRQYRVTTTAVQRAEDLYITDSSEARLLLITCYPFDGLLPGTPLRYVVTAEAVEPVNNG